MPLLGKKLFSPAKPLTPSDSNETIFTIPHTKEQFRSKDEYDKRLSLYNDNIWTCQATGHINLTHEEAYKSEQKVHKTLREQFPAHFEKTVLQHVHHNTTILEQLVDQAWTMTHQALVIDEPVSLKVKAAGKMISGKIVKVNELANPQAAASNCSSPSSDKENTSTDEGSQSKTPTGTPKKWTAPKLLPNTYNVKLDGQEKIISAIPGADLVRTYKPPSKELLRLFIRAHAVKVGPNQSGPWVVSDNMIKKYSLVNKFSDFFVSPLKMAEAMKKAEQEAKKRKSSKQTGNSAKKQKTSDSKIKNKDKKNKKSVSSPVKKKSLVNGKGTPKKGTPKKSKKDSSESDEDIRYALPSKKKKDVVDLTGEDSDSSDDDICLAEIKRNSPKKSASSSKASTPKKSSSASSTPKKKKSDKEDKVKKGTPKKKGLKQMTLFDMSKKKGMKTPDKKPKPVIASPPRTPAIAGKIKKAMKDGKDAVVKHLINKAATELSALMRSRLPPDIKEKVQARYEKIEENKKLKSMSAEEKEAYLKKKREEVMKQRQEEMKKKREEMAMRYEDTEIPSLQPLPAPKLVSCPDGIPNELFGDVAMVTEFISCYSALLMPDDDYPIMSDALMKALCSGKEGFAYLSRVLVILLQTLLQDEIAEDYKELKVALRDIPVNAFTTSELVRLCMRRADLEDHMSDDSVEEEPDEIPEELIQKLENNEFFSLSPSDKLQVLMGLCHRIMGSYSVQDHMEEMQKEASSLWKRKIAELKEKNDKLKEEKQKKKEGKQKASDSKTETGGENGKKEDDKGKDEEKKDTEEVEIPPDENDLATIVKKRRVMAAKAAAEKEERDREKRRILEEQLKIQKIQKDKETFEMKFNEGINRAKLVMRQSSIGTDRNHNRYWIFQHTTPGLYIEKGWACEDIGYNVEIVDRGADSDVDGSVISQESQEKDKSDPQETTFPHCGQNLWFTYDSVKDLDTCLSALHPQGIRESTLKTEIKKKYDQIVKAINLAKRTNNELRTSDGETELLEGFKAELIDTEMRLRNGGLGGVPDFEKWEEQVTSSSDFSTLGNCLIETQRNVTEKFVQGVFAQKAKSKSKISEELKKEDEEDEEEERDEEKEEVVKDDETLDQSVETKENDAVVQWTEAVESASTLSRFHVLLGILDSCIKWEKSAENAKCKICRKKDNDNKMLLCDECNQPFHMYCLRPQLLTVPEGDWLCPACMPLTKRRRISKGGYRELNGESSEDEDEEEGKDEAGDHDTECFVCEGTEDLVLCSTCPAAYHLDCHEPPLRRAPRGHWVCTDCKTGVKSRRRNKSRKAKEEGQYKGRYTEDDFIFTSNSDTKTTGPRPRGRPRKAAKRKRRYESDDDYSVKNEGAKRRRQTAPKRAESARSSRRQSTDSDSSGSKGRTSRNSNVDPAAELKICEDILARVVRHRMSWPFREPVSQEEVPDYYEVITNPVDLTTVKNRLICQDYPDAGAFIQDMELLFGNSATYNSESSEVGKCGSALEKYFIEMLEKNLPRFSYERFDSSSNVNRNTDHAYSSRRRK